MKQMTFKTFFLALVMTAAVGFSSCKNKAKDTSGTTDSSTQLVNGVDVATDEELTRKVNDATKDYPDVQATVTNGEVTLAGSVDSARYQKLIQSINDLHPKKFNNLVDKK